MRTLDDKTRLQNYVPVLFLTLTQRNGTPKEILWERAEHFYQQVSNFTRTHLQTARGYEGKNDNTHEHGIVLCPKDEVSRFWKRMFNFDPSLIGQGKWISPEQLQLLRNNTEDTGSERWVMKLEAFDEQREQAAYRYVLEKHTEVLDYKSKNSYCPRYYSRCKKGKCEHSLK